MPNRRRKLFNRKETSRSTEAAGNTANKEKKVETDKSNPVRRDDASKTQSGEGLMI